MGMGKRKIIIASASPRRKELARAMGLDFTVEPSSYEEDMGLKMRPGKLVMTLAYGKAVDVAKRHKDEIVIGADTVVAFRGKVLGKPKSQEEAYKMLKMLSGKMNVVYSGYAIIDCRTKKVYKGFDATKVYFKKLSDKEMWKYIKTGHAMDKAGAYGMQDLASIFIKKIDGCYFNVLGLPIPKIYGDFQKMGVDIFLYERWRPE